jgi:hypothetical protein
MKNITGVGFICFGVNINAYCFYGNGENGQRATASTSRDHDVTSNMALPADRVS